MSELKSGAPNDRDNNDNKGNPKLQGDNNEAKNEANKPATVVDPALARFQKLWIENIPCIIVNKPDGTEYSIKYKSQKRFQTRRIRLSHLPPRIPNAIRILITTVKSKKVHKKKTCLPYKKFKKM
ncbi:PREDICTED: uncharacterized protein LOC106119635 [Papilio xuthus]|uniref:Uncharacterized protein LOC106119635 n=1 Tax=Papilio xuthus TaxID=66420 RepID=A0A194PX21_PAPXU|nr:PREDICTED: uncharacterized protein LOC106119635 [Papilio xuthus]KPI95690.1 hypothetical protein RR46_11403 [Papilio xuthus]